MEPAITAPQSTSSSFRFSAGLLAGVSLLLVVLLWSGFRDLLLTWELNTLSVRQRLFSLPPRDRSPKTPIALVNYDDKTAASQEFQRLFGNPMSRAAPAYATRFFQRSKATSTLFDLSFNGGERDPAGDQTLVNSSPTPVSIFPSSGHTVASALFFNQDASLGFERQTSATRHALQRQAVHIAGFQAFPQYARLYTYAGLSPPYAALMASGMQFYAANSTLSKSNPGESAADLSGEDRRWTPFARYGGHVFPTLALGAALNGEKNLSLTPDGLLSWNDAANKRHFVHLGTDGLPLIKWYGHGVFRNKPVYPEYSLVDVVFSEMALECREHPTQIICRTARLPAKPLLSPALFRNRHVLVGMTLANTGDTHQSIYGPRYFGVYILANTLDNLLHDDFVHPSPQLWNLLALFGLPLLLGLGSRRFRSVPMICLLAVTLAVGYFVLSIYLYNELNVWIRVIEPILALAACFTTLFIYRFLKEQKQRRQLRFAFGKYVPPAVMELIERNPSAVTLGGVRREMSFLFSDIRGFTAFSDHNPPEAVQRILTAYFSRMNGIILHQCHGSINKLIGDAIMAYWGFPLENEDHAFLAVSAAMAMRDAAEQWRAAPDKPPFHIGIGVNTGDAVIGNVGSEDFMDFTVIGDAVNVASRLEQLNKTYQTTIIISAETYERVKDRIQARPLGWVRLQGKEADTKIFEPLGFVDTRADSDGGSSSNASTRC